ncbi:OmpP1/FadL family transporter [Mesoterricola silvestris]|uniref:Aromatic hydrocarbon degradation protein n=1 Tax=Mesoterricola silvestris TaxID=2927979 RepID=A0AA48KAI2_9BACT|nr:outer membrane protein transport protein [Mesoterricola silvestris]BDU74135.1 aromatic hydrocarbon degradation protein [Mesoterricola silvestris]
MQTPLRRPLTCSALTLLLAPAALASGFQLREQSPSAQGNSFAGISAGGTDIGSMFFNPATLTLFQGNEFVAGASLVQPSAKLEGGSASRATALGGGAITGTSGGDAGRSAPLPVLYGLWSLSPDLKLGFSLNSPFGLTSEYGADWIGRYHAMKSTMKVAELAASVAWRLNPQWTVAASVVARHVDATLSNAVDFGAVGAAYRIPGYVPGARDGAATVRGTQWRPGYKVGLLFQPAAGVRIGAAYHSAIDFKLKGDVTYQGVPAALAAGFRDCDATPMANQPGTASLGAAWDATPTLTLQAEAARTFWSHFKEIRIAFASGQADSVTPEHWKDTWFLALGLTWRPGGAWTLRTGAALDQTATTDTYRTPRIPDAERIWASVGAGYAVTRAFSVDLGWSRLFVKNANLGLNATPGGPDFFRGTINGTFHNRVDILALQGRLKF